MIRSCLAILACFGTPAAWAQEIGPHSLPLPTPPRDAGVYHVATGTWTRSSDDQAVGSKVLYNSNTNSGYFGAMGVPCDIVWTDEGRIPSTSGHPNAKSDLYLVDGFQIAYCSSVGPVGQLGAVTFYGCYESCTDPVGITPLSHVDLVLPGSPSFGSVACWIVTVDLSGSSHEFEIAGDCDGVFDGTTELDNFGWTLTLRDQGTGGFNGPILNDCPNNWAYGDGTYYQNPDQRGLGLGTIDQFWLADPQGCYSNGCYWFSHWCGFDPFGSLWQVLYGDNDDTLGERYCMANPNSTGSAAALVGSGSASVMSANLALTSTPTPNTPGIFCHAREPTQVPFGNSYLCLQGDIRRGTIVVASGNLASYLYDGSDPKHDLAPFVGATRHFQHWFRDPAGGGAGFNLSDALAVRILP